MRQYRIRVLVETTQTESRENEVVKEWIGAPISSREKAQRFFEYVHMLCINWDF